MSNAQNSSENGTALRPGIVTAVTGATGFIGGRLVEMLAERGAEVVCLIRGNQAGMRLHRAGAHIRKLDLTNAEAVRAALEGTDVVFHLAYDWGDTAWNHKALRTLIEVCSAIGCRLVYASSFVVYELPKTGVVSEESPGTLATEGYAHTKLALETELLDAVRDTNLLATIVQPTIVYGPFSHPWTIDPASQLLHGTVVLPDAGEGICNAVYVDDVVSAMLLAATCAEAIGQRYLVSGAAPITWGEFYEAIARALGVKGPQYRPTAEIKQAGNRASKLLRMVASPQHLIRKLTSFGPNRKLTAVGLRFLPQGTRHKVRHWLDLPTSEWSGHTHLPTPGHCDFLQQQSTIAITKASTQLGYVSAFNLEKGMVPTTRFLKQRYSQHENMHATLPINTRTS